MDLPQKAAGRPSSSRSSSGDEGSNDSQQSGRLPSSLNAERAAATLPTSDKTNSKPSSSPIIPSSSTANEASDVDSAIAVASALPLSDQIRNHNAHAPTIPSPLHTFSSDDPPTGESETESSRRTSDGSGKSPLGAPLPGKRTLPLPRGPLPPRPFLRGPLHKSTLGFARPDQLRSASTLTVRDLGSDYTRYYNPFSDSARNSVCDTPPKTPVIAYNSNNSNLTTEFFAANPVNPFSTPNASTTRINEAYDTEKNIFLLNDRLGAPYDEKGALAWPLITDGPEDDDDMHMPHPDDDIKFKPKLKDHFRRDTIFTTIGLFLMLCGILFIFVGTPILSSKGIISYNPMYDTPLDQMPNYFVHHDTWATVNNNTYPLLNLRSTLIDPDTPDHAMKKKGEFGDEFELVFSDEFNANNRTFYEGDDPYWYAPDIWYGATKDLEWYDPDAVTTYDGVLELRLDRFINHGLNFRSGMLNSWNHLCFKGGIFEVSVSMPGPAGVAGLWPGAWTMGNLGRPGYLATTDGLWPYTYQACDAGITPNQSSYDGLSRLPGQRLPSCTCPGEDHPTPGKGRGAPEIDIVEGGVAWNTQKLPIATQSYQVAPFDIWYYPDYNFTAFPDFSVSYTNGYTGGPYQQAISATTNLNRNWYDGKAYQRYSFEYMPGEGEDAHIVWKVGGQTTFMMDGRAIGPNGNIQSRQISEEPMSLVLNLGISESWTVMEWEHLKFPTVLRVDYVRWYQRKDQNMVTCDPPGFETTGYIKDHMSAYTNPNFTQWNQTGYDWPLHKLNSDC